MDFYKKHTINKVDKVYHNDWIELTHYEVIHPTGAEGVYGVVHFKNKAVGVVPLDEKGFIYLVGQYRFPLDTYTWEIPEGGCPIHEDSLQAAKRELREETGLIAEEYQSLAKNIQLSNSVSDEIADLYLAKNLHFRDKEPDDTELLQVKKVKFEEAVAMVENGQIIDALSVMAILMVAQRGV